MVQPIEMIRGTTNVFHITITDADGFPYPLKDGEKLHFGVKQNPKDKDLLISKIVTSGTDGGYSVKIDPGDTADLEYGRYVYDVGLESGTEYFNVIEVSTFVIKPNVTEWGDGS